MLSTFTNYLRGLFRRASIVANLTAENMALRQQIIVLKRNRKRPVLYDRDRIFWVILSRLWSGWRNVVLIVQPETVVRWHKRAFERLLVISVCPQNMTKIQGHLLLRSTGDLTHEQKTAKLPRTMCPQNGARDSIKPWENSRSTRISKQKIVIHRLGR